MRTIKITENTYLKAKAEPAIDLKESDRFLIKAGTELKIAAVDDLLHDNHIKFTLALDDNGNQISINGKNTFYVFVDHTDFIQVPKKTSQRGIDLIKEFEGCELEAYYDAVDVLTIGYGHTGADVYENTTITQAQADKLLAKDLAKFENGVYHAVSAPINQNQFDALVCFAYNVGLGALQSSTLLKVLNACYYQQAASEFLKWDKADGVSLPGLTRRRKAESELFCK